MLFALGCVFLVILVMAIAVFCIVWDICEKDDDDDFWDEE